ncbi:MAG: hypothetical protein Q8Q81_00495 [Oxalobacteraceae bacterium]|nr:hypothetical protein [Oxalobacteraceae bacterium]
METKTPPSIKPIEIFKAGSFTASNGKQYSFTPAQVQELADTYNPAFSDAPLVVGHPKLTSPRFGHAGKLYVNAAGVLCADAADVVPEFAQAVNARHYPKVSASIYLPDAPGNPTPGKHYLRHIGFLGGAAPAVKGLKSVEFSEAEEGVADFGYEDRVIVQLFRNLRDWFIATVGTDKAQEIIPSYSLDDIASAAIRDDLDDALPIPAFSDPNPNQPTEAELSQQKALDDQAAALALQKKELDGRAAALALQEAALKKTGHADFAESLCTEGRLLPAQKAPVVEIMSQLDAANQIADFAAGDENHGKTGADLFKEFLSAQPKQVEFKRVSQAAGDASGSADFAAPPGTEVNPESMELYRLATQYQQAHPGVDIVAAAKAVAQ